MVNRPKGRTRSYFLMYRKIRRELSIKNTTVAYVYARKAWKNCYILSEKVFQTHKHTHTDSLTDKRDNIHEKKIFVEWRRKMHEKRTLFEETFLRGGLGRCREKKAQGIDRSKEMHTQGEFYLNTQPQSTTRWNSLFFSSSARKTEISSSGMGLRWRARSY